MQKYNYLILEIKEFINQNDLLSLQQYFQQLDLNDTTIPWDFVYQKIYLHSCLKKNKEIKEWFESLISLFNPISQSAIKHTFHYGNYLMNK